MAEQQLSVKVITEVSKNSGNFTIHCFSDMLEDGTTRPSVFKAQLPTEPKIIDNVDVKEGELALTYKGETVGELNVNGELIIHPDNDDANKYSVQNQDLIYNE